MDKKVWLALAILSLGGCRIVSQQELADLKSPPNPHMANIRSDLAEKHRAAGGRKCASGCGVNGGATGRKRCRCCL